LRTELHPRGLEVVTVALDVDAERAARYIARADPDHPSLIDQEHALDRLLGIVNVPSGVWIDEAGVIVRPPEVAFPENSINDLRGIPVREDLPPYLRETLELAQSIPGAPGRYVAALRDWVELGPASRYRLTPDQVVERSRPRPPEVALAAAHFELAQYLHRAGDPEAAVPHFREAHRLQPENWTYKRQAWSLVRRDQGPSSEYDSDWVSEVRRVGPDRYYEPLDLESPAMDKSPADL